MHVAHIYFFPLEPKYKTSTAQNCSAEDVHTDDQSPEGYFTAFVLDLRHKFMGFNDKVTQSEQKAVAYMYVEINNITKFTMTSW